MQNSPLSVLWLAPQLRHDAEAIWAAISLVNPRLVDAMKLSFKLLLH
ncbi:hypothetical protein RchiOBHm_Chr2g0095241 [Rosa chinensis]|uniref:Uncharacterized protein n=1 Tax=Rosa chinensis TaxID=74649 RepID=A0A2P6RKT2_ROSCH|nr:hypothetical protein RchiOBHm_Chr2g0095241 [Rosa chinensis]